MIFVLYVNFSVFLTYKRTNAHCFKRQIEGFQARKDEINPFLYINYNYTSGNNTRDKQRKILKVKREILKFNEEDSIIRDLRTRRRI